MQFDGYLKVIPSKDEDVVLPAVEVGESLTLEKLDPHQNFTKPPARYTEASLVKELEKGISVDHLPTRQSFPRYRIVVM